MEPFNLLQTAARHIREYNTCFVIELRQVLEVWRIFIRHRCAELANQLLISHILDTQIIYFSGDTIRFLLQFPIFRNHPKTVKPFT